MTRHRLPDRRQHDVASIVFRGRRHSVGCSRFENGELAEVFIDPMKPGSEAAEDARDIAILISLALQHGEALVTARFAAPALDALQETAQ